jgi:hypothetical protein
MLYGVVQFFGVLQFQCILGKTKNNDRTDAILLTLDPVTGEEKHRFVDKLKLVEPPFSYPLNIYLRNLQLWMSKLRTEAVKRGATTPPDLSLKEVHVDK